MIITRELCVEEESSQRALDDGYIISRLNSVYLIGAEPLRLKLLVCRSWPAVPCLEALDKRSWPEHSRLETVAWSAWLKGHILNNQAWKYWSWVLILNAHL